MDEIVAFDTPLVFFRGYTCSVDVRHYIHPRTLCLRLLDADDQSVIATATSNLESYKLKDNSKYTWIKTWSENEGILEALVAAGIVKATGRTVQINQYGTPAHEVEVLINVT